MHVKVLLPGTTGCVALMIKRTIIDANWKKPTARIENQIFIFTTRGLASGTLVSFYVHIYPTFILLHTFNDFLFHKYSFYSSLLFRSMPRPWSSLSICTFHGPRLQEWACSKKLSKILWNMLMYVVWIWFSYYYNYNIGISICYKCHYTFINFKPNILIYYR